MGRGGVSCGSAVLHDCHCERFAVAWGAQRAVADQVFHRIGNGLDGELDRVVRADELCIFDDAKSSIAIGPGEELRGQRAGGQLVREVPCADVDRVSESSRSEPFG